MKKILHLVDTIRQQLVHALVRGRHLGDQSGMNFILLVFQQVHVWNTNLKLIELVVSVSYLTKFNSELKLQWREAIC